MEWELRIVLGGIGALIIGYAVFDRLRRVKSESTYRVENGDKEKTTQHSDGFDLDGVGQVRVVKQPINTKAMPDTLSAARDDFQPIESADDISAMSGETDYNDVAAQQKEPELIYALSLIAGDQGDYAGEQLLHNLIERGCRFGEMNIFHRYRSAQSKAALFSVANAFNPGTFDIEEMSNQSFKGVSFFIGIPGPADPELAYRTMVETARALHKILGGKLLDAHRSVFTEQRYQHDLEQISDYKRKKMTRHSS